MLSQKESDCLRACHDCAAACLQCVAACLSAHDPKALAHCIALDLECADICRLAAASLARGDVHRRAICSLCAAACQGCGAECAKHAMAHCQQCAEACQRCVEACHSMAH